MNTITKYKIPQIGALTLSATACLSVGVTGDWEASQFGEDDYPNINEYTTEAGEEVYTYRGINMSLNADNSATMQVTYVLSYDGEREEQTYSYSGSHAINAGNYDITLAGDSFDLEFVCTLEADDSLGCDAYVGEDEVTSGATFIRSGVKN